MEGFILKTLSKSAFTKAAVLGVPDVHHAVGLDHHHHLGSKMIAGHAHHAAHFGLPTAIDNHFGMPTDHHFGLPAATKHKFVALSDHGLGHKSMTKAVAKVAHPPVVKVALAYTPLDIGDGLAVQNVSYGDHIAGKYINNTDHCIKFTPVMYGTSSTTGAVFGTEHETFAGQVNRAMEAFLEPHKEQVFYFNGGRTHSLIFAAQGVHPCN